MSCLLKFRETENPDSCVVTLARERGIRKVITRAPNRALHSCYFPWFTCKSQLLGAVSDLYDQAQQQSSPMRSLVGAIGAQNELTEKYLLAVCESMIMRII